VTLNRLWLVVALALPALLALLVPLAAVDLAYQVRAGDEILRTGTLPGVDTYTFTVAGSPWTDQQWLAQVLLGGGHSLGGWELLTVLRAALVAVLAGLLVAVAMTRGASPRAAAILSLGAFLVAVPALALRPQLFGMVAFASLLLLAARRHGHPAQYLAAPLVVALWANLHGSFVLAPLLLGYAWLDDAVQGRSTRVSLVVMVLGAAATLVNPFGSQVWAYAAGIGTDATITGQVSEWQRTSPLTVQGLLFYASAVVALLIALRGRGALRWPDWLWLAGLLAIGAWAERGVAWWPLGMVYVLAPALAAVRETGGEPRAPAHRAMPPAARARRLNAIVAAVLVLGLLVALPWWRPSDPLTGRVGLLSYAPAGLAARLRQLTTPGTRVFAPQTWGSWFEWSVPDARYFVDSRFELFPADVWTDYDAVARGADNAADVVDRWRVSILVVPAGSDPPSGWTAQYRDADGAILTRGGT
jgi:hypothetical protein